MTNRGVGNHKIGKSAKSAICLYFDWKQQPATAYQIARETGYSPMQISRVLKQMFKDGLVIFKVEPYRAGERRIWAALRWSKMLDKSNYVFSSEQLELPI